MSLDEKIKALNEKENNILTKYSIDHGMRDIIEKFMEKGVVTYSCCEGHFEDGELSNTYICFKYNKNLVKQFMDTKEFDIIIERSPFIQEYIGIEYKRCLITKLYYQEYFEYTKEEFLDIKEATLNNIFDIIDNYGGELN